MLVVHPESVVIVPVEDDALVVVVQSRAGSPSRTVELPAGCLEPGEQSAAAAARELGEECSLHARCWRPLGRFLAAPAYSTELVRVFEASGLEPAAGAANPGEDIIVQRAALTELPGLLSDAASIAAYALWVGVGGRKAGD
jgi:ADP-ribose pyrophosphatase